MCHFAHRDYFWTTFTYYNHFMTTVHFWRCADKLKNKLIFLFLRSTCMMYKNERIKMNLSFILYNMYCKYGFQKYNWNIHAKQNFVITVRKTLCDNGIARKTLLKMRWKNYSQTKQIWLKTSPCSFTISW